MKIREAIERDLGDEPQSVVKVYETDKLRVDFAEYVLTNQLARDFDTALTPIVESTRPAAPGSSSVGVWVSGFFGSGKSHFAKVAGHLAANTRIGDEIARSMFARLIHAGNAADDRLAELLQEAATYGFGATLVAFDIAAAFAPADAGNVGRTFLRVLYQTVGLSTVIPFAERELELQKAGLYDDFVALYEKRGGSWDEEKNLASSVSVIAECLADLLPDRYTSPTMAVESLRFELDHLNSMNIEDVVKRIVRWLDGVQAEHSESWRLVFVADEVGAWAGRDQTRIEQVRSFVEELGVLAQGRIWLIVTSQEKLSEVLANLPNQDPATARALQQRLEARFRHNVHLESSEVGTVIEDRVLKKKPTSREPLEKLWHGKQGQLNDFAASPGLEMGGTYPPPELESFFRDYPFLPYQIPAAADLFGGMRGVKVSSGARSMIKVVFDAVQHHADAELGRVVSWDEIFDSSNRDNEFADEQYLGSQGLNYLASADRDVTGTPIVPSRVLKVLWLVGRSERIPRTVGNLARMLVQSLDTDVLQLEADVKRTLEALEAKNFVRLEAATGQWRFLTQDQVTIERIVQRIAEDDVKGKDVRDEQFKLYSARLQSQFNGRLVHGTSNTVFEYGVFLGDTPIKNEEAPVQLRLSFEGTTTAQAAEQENVVNLEAAVVHWIVPVPAKLDERLRRAIAIERLPGDEEFRRIATDRTKREAKELAIEADSLREDAAREVQRALDEGKVLWAGQVVSVGGSPKGKKGAQTTARTEVERALHDRIDTRYSRFHEGDLVYNPSNIEKLFAAAPSDRRGLDPSLGFFDQAGHAIADHPVLAAIAKDLSKTTKNTGKELAERFRRPPFGWPADLVRYGTASLFVEGRLSVVDASGKDRIDDYRLPKARTLFGTGQFRTSRFDVEEETPTPEERSEARALLKELGTPAQSDTEIDLKEAGLTLTGEFSKRMSVVERAREAAFPLPTIYDAADVTLADLSGEGSRAKFIRGLLAHADTLRSLHKELARLEVVVGHNGLAQYRRSQELLRLAEEAGLFEDPLSGGVFQEAFAQYAALKDQRRVLDEWEGAIKDYRGQVVGAYRSIYVPLREDVVTKVAAAREAIVSMPEFDQLKTGDRAQIRADFLGEGRPLAEISMPALHDEEQLLGASQSLSIPYMRTALAALDSQVSLAKTRVLELFAAAQEQDAAAKPIVVWNPAHAFAGAEFIEEDDVDMAFESVKDQVKDLIRQGKVVRVL